MVNDDLRIKGARAEQVVPAVARSLANDVCWKEIAAKRRSDVEIESNADQGQS